VIVALRVQRLPRRVDQVLAVGYLVGVRSGNDWFSPGDVSSFFETLRLPRPGNVSQALANLREAGLVVRRTSGGSWTLTPEGRVRVADLLGEIDEAAINAEVAASGSAQLDEVHHPLIPPELAPVRFAPPIRRLIERFPFERNVFCMTRFPRSEPEDMLPDPVQVVIRCARSVLAGHGLVLHLASDRNADDDLFGNIAAHMWACKFGLGLFETRYSADFNDNMQIELGAMLMTGRRCALLKDTDTPTMPTDFVGHIYKPVDFRDVDAVGVVLDAWVTNDLGLSP
jgi:hypothetical protein